MNEQIEQITMNDLLYGNRTGVTVSKKENKPKIQEKIVVREKNIIPYSGFYIRTVTGEVYKVYRVKKYPRRVYCGHANHHTRDTNNDREYVKPKYKVLYDAWVQLDNDGKIYEDTIYNENIMCQCRYIIDCFCNGDFLRLKSGQLCRVIGWKKGAIKQKEYYKNIEGKPVKITEDYPTSFLYCELGKEIIKVYNDDINYKENIDTVFYNGGEIVDTIYYGLCVVLGATKYKIHVRQFYGSLDENLREAFIKKNEIKGSVYLEDEQ